MLNDKSTPRHPGSLAMPLQPKVDAFLSCLRHSELIDADRFAALRKEIEKQGAKAGDPRAIAEALIRDETLTSWQAEHLLRGKRRGFVIDKYRLLSPLGRGGMNAVYLAEHSLMRRRCAIKIQPQKQLGDQSSVERFHREARAVALLDHPNIVRAYDFGKVIDGNRPIHFFAMELVVGESLEETVIRDGPLPPVEAANFIRQVADGLAHAHAADIVHRDIKPGNLLVDGDGVVKILDLGLAKFFGDEPVKNAAGGQQVVGTVDFLSPEQALNSQTVDARSDIYSLGCTLYFLLVGHAPFPEGTLTQRLVGHVSEKPASVAEKRADVPADLVAIVDRMMAKKPADRIQTAEEVTETLRRWIVRNADKQWLRKNPGVLTGAGGPDGTPVSDPAGLEISTPAPRSVIPVGSTVDMKLAFQPDPTSVMDSKIFRQRTAPIWWQFLQRTFGGRRRSEQSDEESEE
jgi:eukaryotic-like serine/threonine-protein kinase